MPRRLEHLSPADLHQLAMLALAQLPPRQRNALLARFPAGESDSPHAPPAVAAVQLAAERLLDALHDAENDLGRLWAEGPNPSDPVEVSLREPAEALSDSTDVLARWLSEETASADLRASVDEACALVERVLAWRSERTPQLRFVDLLPQPAGWEGLRTWLAFADPTVDVATLVARIVERSPSPTARPLLAAATGRRARAVHDELVRLASEGNPGAARWLVHESTSEEVAVHLDRYAALAPDLGSAWAVRAEATARWEDLAAAAARGIDVPVPTAYRALLRTGRAAEAWRVGLSTSGPGAPSVDLCVLWDDAAALDDLSGLREAALGSARPEARWVARDEAELLVLPSRRYDHEAAKEVVRYAVARLTQGERPSLVRASQPSEALLARLATAPGAHDGARCLAAALDALERLIAFHVAGRSRTRYTRAVVYWREHQRLATEHSPALPTARGRLEMRFAEELRRIPALREELGGLEAASQRSAPPERLRT